MHPLIEMFRTCGVGSNTTCQICRRESGVITNALGPWLLAEPVSKLSTVLFVGKVARGDSLGQEVGDYLEDVTEFGSDFIVTSSWPYWSYTRDIIVRTFGSLEAGLPRTSFTNIVKCNNETTLDTTSYTAKVHCISENRFIWREIEFLRPRLVVFYTSRTYDEFIDAFMPDFAATWRDNADQMIAVGQKTMPWWDRSFFNAEGIEELRFLRIGHPERKNNEDFVELVSTWLINN